MFTNSRDLRASINLLIQQSPHYMVCCRKKPPDISPHRLLPDRKADIAHPRWEPHLRATGRHLPYGSHSVTCHPTQVNAPHQTPAMQAGTRFTYPGGMEGWVDLVDLIAPEPGVELATFRSRVRCPATAPPREKPPRSSLPYDKTRRTILPASSRSNLKRRRAIP